MTQQISLSCSFYNYLMNVLFQCCEGVVAGTLGGPSEAIAPGQGSWLMGPPARERE